MTVVIDGTEAVSAAFGESYASSFPLGDVTQAHDWSVDVDAVDEGFDVALTGSSTPCTDEEPAGASAALTLAAASCASAQAVVLGDVINASWGEVTSDQGSYSVTATAVEGYLFDDDLPTREFSGSLAAMIPTEAEECAPSPVTVTVTESISSLDCSTPMVTTSTSTTTTGWVYDTPTAAWVAGEPNTVVATSEIAATIQECPAATLLPEQVPPSTEDGIVAGLYVGDESALPDKLAHNGTDPTLPVIVAIALFACGLALRHGDYSAVSRRKTR